MSAQRYQQVKAIRLLAVVLTLSVAASVRAQHQYNADGVSRQSSARQAAFFGRKWKQPYCPPTPIIPKPAEPHKPMPPAQKEQPQVPQVPEQPEVTEPTETPFDTDLASGLETAGGAESLSPAMLGDFVGVIFFQDGRVLETDQELARARIINRYKAADNTSPIPRSRLFYSFNYFSDAFDTTGDIDRHTLGVELAFFDGLMSAEIRQAVDTFRHFGEPDSTVFANLRAAFKAIIIRRSNWLISGGMGVGFPTGEKVDGTPGNNFYLSPFVGYLINTSSRSFVQGFQQFDFPTDADDQVLMHTDIGGGFWLLSGNESWLPGWVGGLIPTAEMHIYTPLGDEPGGGLTGLLYRDVLNVTLGSTMIIGDSCTLAIGVGIPLSQQKDYDTELQIHFQWFFGPTLRSMNVPVSM